jgi:surface polysaccharide O-acyltransferase-like enzyme
VVVSDRRSAPPGPPARRLPGIDLLKIVLAVMVVGLHAQLWRQDHPLAGQLLGEGLFRLAVPTFLLINGWFFGALGDRSRQRAWIGKLLRLYLAWSLIYGADLVQTALASPQPGWTALRLLLLGDRHLWYLPAAATAAGLCWLGLDRHPRALLVLMAAGWLYGFALQDGVPADAPLPGFGDLDGRPWAWRNVLGVGLPFFGLGLLLQRQAWVSRLPARHAAGLAALGLLAVLAEAWWHVQAGTADRDRDLLLSLLPAAPALLLAALRLGERWPPGLVPRETARLAHGVYFSHMALILAIQHLRAPASGTLMLAALTGALLISALLLRSRHTRWLVG